MFGYFTVYHVIADHRIEKQKQLDQSLLIVVNKQFSYIHGQTRTCTVSCNNYATSVNSKLICFCYDVLEDSVSVVGWKRELIFRAESVVAVYYNTLRLVCDPIADWDG